MNKKYPLSNSLPTASASSEQSKTDVKWKRDDVAKGNNLSKTGQRLGPVIIRSLAQQQALLVE